MFFKSRIGKEGRNPFLIRPISGALRRAFSAIFAIIFDDEGRFVDSSKFDERSS